MSSTSPFAGAAVPAEGGSFWLGEFLRTTSLEQGLAALVELAEHGITAPLALWVWPEPPLVAVGVVGSSRFYEVRERDFADTAPSTSDLKYWSFPEIDPERVEIRRLPGGLSAKADHEYENAEQIHDSVGALCWVCDTERTPLRPDELLWIGTLLRWLATRERQLLDAKLKSLAEFAAGAGHEINNPLGTILGRSQLLLRQVTNPEQRRWLTSIGGQALRIRDMISDTMVFARPPVPRKQNVEIEPLIRAVTDRFTEELAKSQVELCIEPETPCPSLTAVVDSEQFQMVVVELLRNAIRAVTQRSDRQGRIGVRTRYRSWQGRDWLEFDLCNNGPELTPTERVHAFDPFFSGRDAGRGLGFGLTKCWRIVTGHEGHMGVNSTPARTVFRTLWPIELAVPSDFDGKAHDPDFPSVG